MIETRSAQSPERRRNRPLQRTLPVLFSCAAVLLLLLGVRASGSSTAGAAKVTGLEAESDAEQLLLTFELRDAFDDELQQRIDSGLATELAYDVRVVRKRRWWFDGVIASGRLRLTALYNSVTREYLINFEQDGDLIESRVVRDADALRDAMTRFSRLPLLSLGEMPNSVQVRVRAELGTRTRLFFIPTTHTTEWAETSEIVQVPVEAPAE